jgi:hypothetical protein
MGARIGRAPLFVKVAPAPTFDRFSFVLNRRQRSFLRRCESVGLCVVSDREPGALFPVSAVVSILEVEHGRQTRVLPGQIPLGLHDLANIAIRCRRFVPEPHKVPTVVVNRPRKAESMAVWTWLRNCSCRCVPWACPSWESRRPRLRRRASSRESNVAQFRFPAVCPEPPARGPSRPPSARQASAPA